MEVLKELTENINEKTGVSRRSFLKGLGALSATAAIYGCGGGENLAQYKTEPSVTPQDNLVLDKELKSVMQCHPFNCGSRCTFKFYVKNGRMVKLTSAGDTPRAGSTAADEAVDVIQRRACVKGYGQIKRNYQPDRLKYPLKQTGQRGDYRGFKRIAWDEAYDTIAGWYQKTAARQSQLGYIPGYGSFFNYLGACLLPEGAPSFENYQNAKYGAIGQSMDDNYTSDLLNSKFILNWGVDATTSFSWQPHNFWYLTKAKEKGIPVVTIETHTTDTATSLSSGYPSYGLPAFVAVRPMTDGAILAAMANVIYRKKLHDETFIKQYCFGFYPGDSTVSQSTMINPLTGKAYTGETFTTPTGMSFVEYLDSIEAEHGGYNGVLQWASNLSGVSTDIIEKLAIAYASTKPATLYGGWGPCRSNNGMHHTWLLTALAAMTGNTTKRGGGPGWVGFTYFRGPVTLGGTKEPITTATAKAPIKFSANCTGKVVLHGTDNRTPEQLRADVLLFNKIDLGAWKAQRDDVNGKDGRLRIEMIAFGGNALNQRVGSLTLAMLAVRNREPVKFTWGMDHFMTPTMAYSDIVLPQTSHLEEDRIETGFGHMTAAWFMNKVIEPMFECKTSYEIQSEILKRLGINYGLYGPRGKKTDLELLKEQWEASKVSARYLSEIDSNLKLPSFDEFRAKGVLEFPIPPEKALLGLTATTPAGKFSTDTGRINFFSPYYFNRDKGLGDAYKKPDGGYYRTKYAPKAMYAKPIEGYPDILAGKVGAKGIKYTLQIKTAHHRRRAHSVYDNVAVVREQFPGVLVINAIDAAARGINNGDIVYVFNDWGCIKVQCIVTRRIRQGTVNVADGEWYRPSTTETYEAWIDVNGDGVPEKNIVPVDVGGAPNSLMHNWEMGPLDPVTGYLGDNNWNGHLVEVSKTHPDKK